MSGVQKEGKVPATFKEPPNHQAVAGMGLGVDDEQRSNMKRPCMSLSAMDGQSSDLSELYVMDS